MKLSLKLKPTDKYEKLRIGKTCCYNIVLFYISTKTISLFSDGDCCI